MIEIYITLEGEPLMMEVEISLSLTSREIYEIARKCVIEEVEGKEFQILLIKHDTAFIRNFELYVESQVQYKATERREITLNWIKEFREIFGSISKDMIDVFSDECSIRTKHIDDEFEFLINKKYGIPTKTRLEEKIRRLGTASK